MRPEFTDVIETTMPAKAMLTAEHFVAHLSTVSAYRVLAEPDRTALLARIRAALPEIVEVSQDVTRSIWLAASEAAQLMASD